MWRPSDQTPTITTPQNSNSQFTPPGQTRQNSPVCVVSASAVWIGFSTTQDDRRQKIWSLNTFRAIVIVRLVMWQAVWIRHKASEWHIFGYCLEEPYLQVATCGHVAQFWNPFRWPSSKVVWQFYTKPITISTGWIMWWLRNPQDRLSWVVVLCPTRHKIGHFGNISPSQSVGLVWKKAKPNTTKACIHRSKNCTTKQNKY